MRRLSWIEFSPVRLGFCPVGFEMNFGGVYEASGCDGD